MTSGINGGWLGGGIRGYIGMTRSGKTTKAVIDARTDGARTRFPIATLDFASAISWMGEPHASCADEVIFDVYSRRVHPKIWTPANELERSKFFKVVADRGAVHIIGDEVKEVMNENYVDKAVVHALNKHGHGRLGPAYWYLTSQRPKYINRDLGPGVDRFFFFCITPGVDSERVAKEFSKDASGAPITKERLETLRRGQYVEVVLAVQD